MVYSIDVDWSNYLEDGWENIGRSILEESCTHKTQDQNSKEEYKETNVKYSGYCEECEISEDDAQPMINYAYPLVTTPSDEDVLRVVKNTCLTVMEKDEDYYLALCGGGMDLSQQIGLAYILIERWIPVELLSEISKQKGLSVSGEDWKLLRSSIIEQLKMEGERMQNRLKDWEATQE